MADTKEADVSPKGVVGLKTSEARSSPEPGRAAANLFTVTLSADTGEIVRLEKLDATGARRDLLEDDRERLAATPVLTLEAVVERAFEAGIACVLGTSIPDEASEESDDEAALRRSLLSPLMELSDAGKLFGRDILGKAILGTAVAQSAGKRTTSPDKSGGPPPA